jgi:hypothetical protein
MKTQTKTVEIGKANDVEAGKITTRIHIRGNPGKEAELIRDLSNAGWTQDKIAEEMGLSQAGVARRQSLLELIPELFERLKKGELRPTAAYPLSRMPVQTQKKYAKQARITVKEVETARKDMALSDQVMEYLNKPVDETAQKPPEKPLPGQVECPHCHQKFVPEGS